MGHDHREPLPTAAEIAKLPPDGGPGFNRLIHEKSPYLLQHARNPVDWYPWGEEAFRRARETDRPVFLSVGYSTCHWCHVMERESFESEEVAKLLNERFVCIKVDREERPDVDAVYMAAVLATTGSGGWPMSVFLTPDQKPFWAGTYFPPEDRFGRPGFPTILGAILDAWQNRREAILEGAERITTHIREQAVPPAGAISLGAEALDTARSGLLRTFDERHGGFGGAPKFPRTHTLSFLLRAHQRSGDARALEAVETTLRHMTRGGLHDQIGGGFHRYATDAIWLVPHFEKMLYDQALIARACLEAYQATGDEQYADVARDVFEYVLRDMTDPRGGFYSAEDADSEGEEGKFYVWTREEILEILGPEDGPLFADLYGVTEEGNYRDEATGARTGSSILHLAEPIGRVAARLEESETELRRRLAGLRAKLLSARGRRVRPLRDDKVLADWNGLMVWSLALGGRALGEPRYTEAAGRAASFVLDSMRRDDGRLLHRYRDGEAATPAYLDDHAFLALGLLDLYEATFEVRWLREALGVADDMLRLFQDAEDGGFHLVGSDEARLIARRKEVYDGAVPSGNSAALLALLRLGRLSGRSSYLATAERGLERFSGAVAASPVSHPFFLMALDYALGPSRELILAGDPGDPALAAMRREVDRGFHPNVVVAFHPSGDAGREIEALVPYLAPYGPQEGKAAAYVCEDQTCRLPTTDPAELRRLLRPAP